MRETELRVGAQSTLERRRRSRGRGQSGHMTNIELPVQLHRALRSVANKFVEITVQLQYFGQLV